jgi:pyruvate,water dikinase
VLSLADVDPDIDGDRVGGKALALARLARAGLRVPAGFVVTTTAYRELVAAARLDVAVGMELGRKDLANMRWEELWDAALRVRRAFLAAPLPTPIRDALATALRDHGDAPLAVRSSALGEDGRARSFAGLHETVLDVRGIDDLADAVRVVWASLWSDAALLYRRELGLDVAHSAMAVLVQPLVEADRSGVAFARDPRAPAADRELIEAVDGRCAELVDGAQDPDRFVLERSTGRLLEHRRGEGPPRSPLLDAGDLSRLHDVLGAVEAAFGWPPDMEWTGRRADLVVLQARPITTGELPDDDRRQYLELRPSARRLEELRRRVVEELIPELEREGTRLAEAEVEVLEDAELADAIRTRADTLARWREVYREAFIPFAHGVRALGTYYTDVVRPTDPYEFLGLLVGEGLLARRRNEALAALAVAARTHDEVRALLTGAIRDDSSWDEVLAGLAALPTGAEPAACLEALAGTLDVAWEGVRLLDSPARLLAPLLEGRGAASRAPDASARRAELERRLLAAAGPRRRAEALRCLDTARLAWRLRDDDNLLLGRVESQLLRAVCEAERRLRHAGRMSGPPARPSHAACVAAALHDPGAPDVEIRPQVEPVAPPSTARPRQLVGQPASPGMASGRARIITGPADLSAFQLGEVLVCDAIQPQITHLVPLACAVVERRGGMLIHGAIIARELGLPCVNGVARVTHLVGTGDLLVVDGHLGVVTIGETELLLEQEH